MFDICSVCQKSVRCDNNCDRIYFSDSCADADLGHHRIINQVPSKTILLKPFKEITK